MRRREEVAPIDFVERLKVRTTLCTIHVFIIDSPRVLTTNFSLLPVTYNIVPTIS